MGIQRPKMETGQSVVLLAVMLIGLLAIIGLAIDGSNLFTARRIMQNGADGAAMAGIQYMVGTNAPAETQLRAFINGAAEANGVPDSDGSAANEVNDHVTIYYTDSRGNRLTTQPCHILPCGAIPSPARGLEIQIDSTVTTFLLGVISIDTADVSARAVAVATGGSGPANIGENVLIAFGSCSAAEKPLDISATNVDFIGGLYSSTWFENRGDNNHYHGQVTYGNGFGYIDTASVPGVYEPNPPGLPQPATTTPGTDPLAGLFTVADFNCTSGSIGSDPGLTCYDLTVHAPSYGNVITTRLLQNESPDGGTPYLDSRTGQLREGIYYAGGYPFNFGMKEMVGTVTLVTSGTIKLTENDLQLTGYLPDTSVIPGLLLYSAHRPASPYDECTNHETLVNVDEEPINTTGNSGKTAPAVYHGDDKSGCVDLDQPSNCYELGSLQYIGLIYAPYGRVATSGNGASYVGAIVAPSIRINGSANRSEGGGSKPDKVGALFVRDPNLFPDTKLTISLDR